VVGDQPNSIKAYYTTKEVADAVGVTAPTVIKWIDESRIEALRTPGGHRRVSHAELLRLLRLCGSVPPDASDQSPSTEPVRVLTIDLEIDFAEMITEFLQLQDDIEAKTTHDLVHAGFLIGDYRPNVIVCTDELTSSTIASVYRCAKSVDAQLVLVASVRTRHHDVLLGDTRFGAVVEKPLKLDSLLGIIRGF